MESSIVLFCRLGSIADYSFLIFSSVVLNTWFWNLTKKCPLVLILSPSFFNLMIYSASWDFERNCWAIPSLYVSLLNSFPSQSNTVMPRSPKCCEHIDRKTFSNCLWIFFHVASRFARFVPFYHACHPFLKWVYLKVHIVIQTSVIRRVIYNQRYAPENVNSMLF